MCTSSSMTLSVGFSIPNSFTYLKNLLVRKSFSYCENIFEQKKFWKKTLVSDCWRRKIQFLDFFLPKITILIEPKEQVIDDEFCSYSVILQHVTQRELHGDCNVRNIWEGYSGGVENVNIGPQTDQNALLNGPSDARSRPHRCRFPAYHENFRWMNRRRFESRTDNQSINQSFDHSIIRPINQSINQSINHSMDRSINQSIGREPTIHRPSQTSQNPINSSIGEQKVMMKSMIRVKKLELWHGTSLMTHLCAYEYSARHWSGLTFQRWGYQ